MKNIIYFVFSVSFFVLGVGCDDPECQSDSDCFADEWCNSGVCLVGTRPVVNNGSNNGTNNSNNQSTNGSNNSNNSTNMTSNNATNTSSNNSNNSTNTNTNNSNNSTNTMSNNATNNEPGGICKADLFDACEDPVEAEGTDNSWFDANSLGSSGGCLNGDEITERTQMVESIICPREPGDWYNQTIIPCDTLTLTIEVRVTPDPGCESDEWRIEINRAGSAIPCTDERLNCFDEGTTKVVRWTLPPGNSVDSWYFGVVNADTSKFTYQAELRIR